MTHEVLFQPLPSLLIVVTTFLLMVWSGYAVLHGLGHGRHRWPAAEFAGPAVTLALWIIALSGAAWASIPLHRVSGPVWIGTLVLAALGIALRILVRRQIGVSGRNMQQPPWLLWATAVMLPLMIMPATLRYGIGDFVNSTYPDAWSYVMVADYLSAVSRGAEGGLAALHQYASHLMNMRNASSAILAHLAIGLGGAKADQAMTLFCLIVLFANVSALIAFARSAFDRTEPALGLAVLAGLGWPANIVFSGNFDQLLLLPLLPLIAALALRAASGFGRWSGSILIGILVAAAVYAYIELAFLGVIFALAFVVPRDGEFGRSLGRALVTCCICMPIVLLLTWPGLDALLRALLSQYAMVSGAARPGEGYFPGLGSPLRIPSAIPALGGEFDHLPWSGVPWLLGAFLCVVTLQGAWSERRRWPVILAFALTTVLFGYFAYLQHYSYGAYKIVSVNIWMVGFLTVSGGIRFAEWAKPRLPKSISLSYPVAALLLVVALDRTIVQANAVHYRQNAFQQTGYREASVIRATIAGAPTLLAVREDLANEWAVFYLSDTPLLIAPYRRYMAQAHVWPLMERSRPVNLAEIRYVVTDRSDLARAALTGARRIWDGQAYSLWQIDEADWAVVADVRNPNGDEPGGIWLGPARTEFLVVTAQRGPAILTAQVQPGPRVAAGTGQFRIALADASGSHQTMLQPGQNRLPIDLTSGRGFVSLAVEEPLSGPISAGGDVRPLALRLTGVGIERNGYHRQ